MSLDTVSVLLGYHYGLLGQAMVCLFGSATCLESFMFDHAGKQPDTKTLLGDRSRQAGMSYREDPADPSYVLAF